MNKSMWLSFFWPTLYVLTSQHSDAQPIVRVPGCQKLQMDALQLYPYGNSGCQRVLNTLEFTTQQHDALTLLYGTGSLRDEAGG